MTPQDQRAGSFARRVFDVNEADVIFVPFFATLSAEMQLGRAKGQFRKKDGNEDYQRQKEVIEFLKNTEAWKRSGGRNHVFVLTGEFFHFMAFGLMFHRCIACYIRGYKVDVLVNLMVMASFYSVIQCTKLFWLLCYC